MAVPVFDAAKYLCSVSGWKLSNLELQKISYIAQMLFMGAHDGARLIETDYEAWDYGPVSPELYHKVKSFGANPVPDIFLWAKPVEDEEYKVALRDVCKHLMKRRAGELVAITHWQDGAWAKHYVPGARNIVIPDEDILDEYRKRQAAIARKNT